MYAMQDYPGEDKLNPAARALLESEAFEGPPYPTSRDRLVNRNPDDNVIPAHEQSGAPP